MWGLGEALRRITEGAAMIGPRAKRVPVTCRMPRPTCGRFAAGSAGWAHCRKTWLHLAARTPGAVRTGQGGGRRRQAAGGVVYRGWDRDAGGCRDDDAARRRGVFVESGIFKSETRLGGPRPSSRRRPSTTTPMSLQRYRGGWARQWSASMSAKIPARTGSPTAAGEDQPAQANDHVHHVHVRHQACRPGDVPASLVIQREG